MRKVLMLAVLALAACGGEDGGEGCWPGSPNWDASGYPTVCAANPDERIVRYCVDEADVRSELGKRRMAEAGCAELGAPASIRLVPYPTLEGDPAGYAEQGWCEPCTWDEMPDDSDA